MWLIHTILPYLWPDQSPAQADIYIDRIVLVLAARYMPVDLKQTFFQKHKPFLNSPPEMPQS